MKEFLDKPIDSDIPYLLVDASYFKVRNGIQYVNKALLVIAEIRFDGDREIFGARFVDKEHELIWEDPVMDLKELG